MFKQIICEQTREQFVKTALQMIEMRKDNFTQDEVAEMLNVSRQTISSFEKGLFNFNLFDQYCGIFGHEIILIKK